MPWWMTVLLWLGIVLIVLFMAALMLYWGQGIWSRYAGIAPADQAVVGRIISFSIGLVWLWGVVKIWQQRLYLQPPMRDLVTTPGTPFQILKLSLRLHWQSEVWRSIALLSLLLYPFFETEWLVFLTAKAVPGLLFWQVPLSALSALLVSVLSVVAMRVMGLSLTLAGASLGWGSSRILSSWRAAIRNLSMMAFLLLIAATWFQVEVILNPTSPEHVYYQQAWEAGRTFRQAMEDPFHPLHVALNWFPPVQLFDAMRSSVAGPNTVFINAMTGLLIWMGLAVGLAVLCYRRGLSFSARVGWEQASDRSVPADAAEEEPRSFDPDEVNGPLEQWLINSVGRMGRATLRFVSASNHAGALDPHLMTCLKSLLVCVILGKASMIIMPQLVSAALKPFGIALSGSLRDIVAFLTGGVWIGAVFLYRVRHLGTIVNVDSSQYALRPHQTGNLNLGHFNPPTLISNLNRPPVATRGDSRYPLSEIFAVGFSDAVLLPTLYNLAWMIAYGLLALLEGWVLGLPASTLIWTVAVAVPAVVELFYLMKLMAITSYQRDYRRSRLITFFQLLFASLITIVVLGLLIGLSAWMVQSTLEKNMPWLGWMGSIHMAVVFDLSLYWLVRWMYVRRRFDADRGVSTGAY